MTRQVRIERATTEQPTTEQATTERLMSAHPVASLTAGKSAVDRPAVAETAEDAGTRAAIDRSAAGSSRGSIILVLLVAAALVAAASGIVLVGGSNAEPYILAFLAVLATVGVFSLFALACGILRVSGGATPDPLVKAIVDGASDGIVVTDHEGRIVYANAAYLDLIDATDFNDMRPVERAFIGDAARGQAARRGGAHCRAARPVGALAALSDPSAWLEPARCAADGMVACRHQRRARPSGKCVSGAAAFDRLSRSRSGGVFLGR
jgi:PAS domain-containing protein